MFKYFLVAALIACVSAASETAEVKTMTSDVRPDGFDIALDITNGISSSSSGDAYGNIKGSYEYTAPGGEHIKVDYVANENGYQPTSDSLPTPPPIPAAILKSLDYLKSHVSKDN